MYLTQRQANFLNKDASELDATRRLTLPPDPSNTRIQGAYVGIWEVSSHSRRPERFAGRSHSSLEFRTPTQVSAEGSSSVTRQERGAPLVAAKGVSWLGRTLLLGKLRKHIYVCTAVQWGTNTCQSAIIAIVLQGCQDPPNVRHSPASTQVKPLLGTKQVWQLAKWLDTETLHFNQTFSERALSSPALEFLLLATRSARQLHSKAFYELTKQVGYALFECDQTCRRRSC